jgi:hypothetical protein
VPFSFPGGVLPPKKKDSVHFSSFSLYDANCPFFGQNCSLPFSLRSLDKTLPFEILEETLQSLTFCFIPRTSKGGKFKFLDVDLRRLANSRETARCRSTLFGAQAINEKYGVLTRI